MAHLACVNLPALPLQLLLRRHPEWAAVDGKPAASTSAAVAVAVVPDGKVQSRMLWVNEAAIAQGVRTGMPYAAGLSLAPGLRADSVPAAEVAEALRTLTTCLQRFSPHVEPSREAPGLFWLDGAGLDRLHPSPRAWVERVRGALREAGYQAAVVAGFTRFGTYAAAVAAGFTRFGTYAAAKAPPGARVFADVDTERAAARRVPLAALGLEPALRDALLQLGVATVADLLALPATGLLERFGPAAWRLHGFAAGLLGSPLQPAEEHRPICEEIVLEYPEVDAARLLFLIKAPFHALLSALAARRQSMKALHFRFLLEGEPPWEVAVRPAAPTRDTLLLMDLVRLQLERRRLASGAAGITGITGIEMLAEGVPSEVQQLSLFKLGGPSGLSAEGARRDLAAGERALARLRAEFGDEAVVRAEPRQGHMPAARFAWRPLERLRAPAPRVVRERRLVRRMFAQPPLLAPQPAGDAPADLARAMGGIVAVSTGNAVAHAVSNTAAAASASGTDGTIARRVQGPYVISGGWWAGEQQREYYFAESPRGEVLWVYHDRRRGRWFQQGRVE